MRSADTNLQRRRQEQLQLRNSLSIVYDVIRDLGLHFKLIEIPGCSMITIGRSEHRFSHLDKDLAWTAQAERVENLDNVYPNTAANGDSMVSDDEDKRNLQNQEEEFKHVMEQLSDLSAKLEASNEEVKALLDQNRAMEEQKEEVERNLRISSRSLLKAEDDVKEAQDRLNTYLVTQSNDEDLRISEQAFAEQNLRLQEKKFAKLVCQLADSEAERLELKKET